MNLTTRVSQSRPTTASRAVGLANLTLPIRASQASRPITASKVGMSTITGSKAGLTTNMSRAVTASKTGALTTRSRRLITAVEND